MRADVARDVDAALAVDVAGMSAMNVAVAVPVPVCAQTWRGTSMPRWRRTSPAGSAMTVADVVVVVAVAPVVVAKSTAGAVDGQEPQAGCAAVAEGMSVMTVAGAVAVVVLMPLCTQTWRGASTLRWRRMSPAGSAMTVADVVVAVTVPAWRQTKGW